MTRKLIVTLEFDMSSMSGDQLMDAGWEGDCECDDPAPVISDYYEYEIADLIPYVFKDESVVAEMFAGSNIFAKLDDVRVVERKWADEA